MAQRIFASTKNIEVGSAVMNIVCNGGPVAAAERIAYFCALHGMNPEEKRRLHVGFSAGRFDFMNRAAGILARNEVEEAAWPALKGKVFREACEIFLRLLSGETLNSDMIAPTTLKRDDFRSDEDWQKVCSAAGGDRDILDIPKRWVFENIKIIPQDWRRNLLSPIIGSHDPRLQEDVNQKTVIETIQKLNNSPTIHGIIVQLPLPKYIDENTIFTFPNFEEKDLINIQKIVKEAFSSTGCQGWGRVDFFVDNQKKIELIEVNSIPGMTDHSLVPMSANKNNLSFIELLEKILTYP